MGIQYYDIYTIGHFISGVISRLIIFPSNRLKSFYTSNGIHLLIEMMENNYHPNGTQLESFKNHVSDCIAFFIGWVLIDLLDITISKSIYYILLFILFIFGFSEITREIYPFKKYGAFRA